MKKITLKNLNLKEVELLSRDQLRNVLGGEVGLTSVGTSSITEDCSTICSNPGDSCQTSECKTGTCGFSNNVLDCSTN